MAVVVQCFHCNAILELDDGFRGGVCRCGECGSLLQVPKGDPAGLPTRAARPAGPPAPAKAGTLRTGTANADTGLSSGRLNPTSDLGGISSGLGHVHKTKPISHVSAQKSPKPANDSTKSEIRPKRPSTEPAPLQSKPPEPAPTNHRPRTPLWLTTLLLLASAALAATIIYIFFFKP